MTLLAENTTTETSSNVGDLLKDLRRIKDERDVLAESDMLLSKQEQAIKAKLLEYQEQTGITSLADHGLSVTFTPNKMRISYTPEKWDGLHKWLVDNNYGYTIQRRLNEAKLRELIDNGVAMPDGIEVTPFTDISIRRKNG